MILVAAVAMTGTTACGYDKVDPGHVGIKVPVSGDGAQTGGAEKYEIVRGRVFYNSFTYNLYKYPTFVQTVQWTADKNEGAEHDQSITVSSKEGTPVTFDVGLSIAFVDTQVPALFKKFRKDAEDLMNTYVRNQTREAINEIANTMPVIDIVGVGRPILQRQAKERLQANLGTSFKVDNLSFLSNPRVDNDIRTAINNVIAQQKAAETAEARVRLVAAESEQRVAKARGDSASAVIAATGQAEANRRMQQSITPGLIQYENAKRWDGHLPQFMGNGAVPFFNVNK